MSVGRPVFFEGRASIKLAATRHGASGPPVILLHGGGQTRYAFDKSARKVAAAGFTAFTVDQRGHGESEWAGEGGYTFFDFADDARLVADALARQHGVPPVCIGASLGGLAALIAQGKSGCFRGLILVDIAPDMKQEGLDAIRGFMRDRALEGFASVEEAAAAIAAYLPHRPKPKSLAGLAKNLRLKPDGRYYWHWDPAFSFGPRGIYVEGTEAVTAAKASASSLNVPALLVRGAESELVGEEELKRFRAMAPEAEFADVSGARHMVAGDDNDAFSTAIISFLRKHFSPAAQNS